MRRQLIFLIVFVFLLAPATAQNQTPQSVQLKGLKERVTITRDERGIPYIDAKNDEDLYFAQGYVTASDRLWQMDLNRRTARGELAEIFGGGPNGFVSRRPTSWRTLAWTAAGRSSRSRRKLGVSRTVNRAGID